MNFNPDPACLSNHNNRCSTQERQPYSDDHPKCTCPDWKECFYLGMGRNDGLQGLIRRAKRGLTPLEEVSAYANR